MQHFHHAIKTGKRGSGKEHSLYIGRKGRKRYIERGDLLLEGWSNLPAWAEDNPARYFSAADRYERRNGSVYREHVISLPSCMSDAQLIELALTYVHELAIGKVCHYAVHMGFSQETGAFNPHLHIMISDRIADHVDRGPEQTFKRHNAAFPEKGGARKESGGLTKCQLGIEFRATRERVASIQNLALSRHGYRERVDARSYRERGVQKMPGRHIGMRFSKG